MPPVGFPSLFQVMAGFIAKPDLKFLFMKEEVHEEIQIKLIEAGVTSVKQFASLVKDADEMRELAAEERALADAAAAALCREKDGGY